VRWSALKWGTGTSTIPICSRQHWLQGGPDRRVTARTWEAGAASPKEHKERRGHSA